MKRPIRLALILSMGWVLAVGGLVAQDETNPIQPFDKAPDPTEPVHIALKSELGKPVVGERAPGPIVPPDRGIGTPGPVAMTDVGSSPTGMGGALLSPRGGALASPKQQARRELRQLIRRLD